MSPGGLTAHKNMRMTFDKNLFFAAVFAVALAPFSETVFAAGESAPASPAIARARRIQIKEVTPEDVKKIIDVGAKLSLAEAVPAALRKNLGIAITRVQKSITAETPEIENAAFDPTLAFSSIYSTSGTPYLRAQNSGTSNQKWANEISLAKKFSYGTQAKLYGQFNRLYNTESGISPDTGAAVGLEIAQPLMSGFGEEVNLAPLVKARKNVMQSGLGLRKSTLDLILDTELAYWNLSASYALVQARLSSLRYAEFVLEQAKKRRDIKAATQEDVLQAEADAASRRVSLVSARQAVSDCDDALRKLLGQTGDELAGTYEVAALADDVPAETMTFRDWISEVRSFDIDSQIREIDREKAELDYRVAEDADRPSLDLVLGAEASGRERSPRYAVSGITNRSGYNLSAGIQFSVPIGFRRSGAELRQAAKARESAALAIAEAVQTAMFNARNAWRACEAARERLDAAKAALKMQRESYEGQLTKYSLGSSKMTDVLAAQDSLDSARLELIQAALDVVSSRAKVLRLDGRILSGNGFTWQEIDSFETARDAEKQPLSFL